MQALLDATHSYLTEKLVPFWAARVVEPRCGGFQTNYGRDGRRTDVTEKSLLAQARCLFTIAHVRRQGFEWPGAEQALEQGLAFLRRHLRAPAHGASYWIVREDGSPQDDRKVLYGHAFLLYGLSEYALLTGEAAVRAEAEALFELIQHRAADPEHGGYFEHFERDFSLRRAHPGAPVHKSLDVHMHLMEAFTTLFELTGAAAHREALVAVTELIFDRMLDPETGTGIAMFSSDWRPVANVELDTVWGADRFDERGKPPEITSYGHNVELAWLYLHRQDVLGLPRRDSLERVLPIFEHTLRHGVDREYGGLFVEGHRRGGVTEDTKEFWQQAEALIGFLDAYALTGRAEFLRAFEDVNRFVFTRMIAWDQGEWLALLDRRGDVLWDHLGTSWKVCYHTVRSMVGCVRRLERLARQKT